MAEYIKREDAVEATWRILNGMGYSEKHNDRLVEEVDAVLNEYPAADVRPVVLCRECKHKGWVQEPEHGKSVDYCRLIERCVDKQFFCAAGEKREES